MHEFAILLMLKSYQFLWIDVFNVELSRAHINCCVRDRYEIEAFSLSVAYVYVILTRVISLTNKRLI